MGEPPPAHDIALLPLREKVSRDGATDEGNFSEPIAALGAARDVPGSRL
jgi:hypothetical protein